MSCKTTTIFAYKHWYTINMQWYKKYRSICPAPLVLKSGMGAQWLAKCHCQIITWKGGG